MAQVTDAGRLAASKSAGRVRRRPAVHYAGRVALYAVLLVLSLLFVLPFVWMVSTSLKDDPQVYHVPPIWFPSPQLWSNYPGALTQQPFARFFVNTLWYALPATVGTILSCAIPGYGFARFRWRGRDLLFYLCLATMMIPFQVQMIPLFITFKKVGWINTYLPLVVPAFFGNAYFIFLLRQFFMTIPLELSDAARIDGCGEFGILWRVIMPLSRPALAVVGLFTFMNCWNDYLGPLIYLNNIKLYPVALGLQQLRANYHAAGQRLVWPYLMAASTVVVAPILLLYFFTQRTFIEGITVTGIKG
ncbi:MAG: carbohydrate ABC transporter permease [Anaerolineae bacterium]